MKQTNSLLGWGILISKYIQLRKRTDFGDNIQSFILLGSQHHFIKVHGEDKLSC